LLAISLTSLDACSSSALTSGSLRQAVASILNAIKHQYPAAGDGQQHPRNGFFRLSVIRRPVRSVKVWCFSIPFRQRKLVRTSTNDLEYAIRTAIRDCLETPTGLLDTNPLPTAGIPQVVAVSVPVKAEALSDIVQTVKAILTREEGGSATKTRPACCGARLISLTPLSWTLPSLNRPTGGSPGCAVLDLGW
jgi:hypothetical protein